MPILEPGVRDGGTRGPLKGKLMEALGKEVELSDTLGGPRALRVTTDLSRWLAVANFLL